MDDEPCAATESLATTVASVGLLTCVIRRMRKKTALAEAGAGLVVFIQFLPRVNSQVRLQVWALTGASLECLSPLQKHGAMTEAPSPLTWKKSLSRRHRLTAAITQACATLTTSAGFLSWGAVHSLTQWFLHRILTHAQAVFHVGLLISVLVL